MHSHTQTLSKSSVQDNMTIYKYVEFCAKGYLFHSPIEFYDYMLLVKSVPFLFYCTKRALQSIQQKIE